MNLLDLNLSAIKSIHPDFDIPDIDDGEERKEYQVIEARSGDPTASYQGIFLHSRLDPKREAQKLIADFGEKSCAVFFGFGLGYYVEEYLGRFPESLAIVVEPDPGLFRLALGARDLAKVLTSTKLTLLLNAQPDTVAALLNTFLNTDVTVFAPRSISRLDEEYFFKLQRVIETFKAVLEILLSPETKENTFSIFDPSEQFDGTPVSEADTARSINSAFLITLTGPKHPMFTRAEAFLQSMAESPELLHPLPVFFRLRALRPCEQKQVPPAENVKPGG